MKHIKWKKGVFYLTLVLSVLLGFLVAKKSAFYKLLFQSMSHEAQDVMRLHHNVSTLTAIYLFGEFLISFAVPFGLVWLLSFITMRIVVRDFTVSDWSLSLTRTMRAKDSRN